MRGTSTGCAALLGIVLAGCGRQAGAVADAAVDGAPDARTVEFCSCCTPFPFVASQVGDVASDGATLYAVSSASGGLMQIGIVTGDGRPPIPIATAGRFWLAATDGALFYAASPDRTFEIHERAGTIDRMLGTVPSNVQQIAGNATDVYVSTQPDLDSSTLWRFSRSAPAATDPELVASEPGYPTYLVLGSTVAAWGTSAGSWLVPLAGPGTPMPLPQPLGKVAFVGDSAAVLHGQSTPGSPLQWNIDEIAPVARPLVSRTLVFDGSFDTLVGDAHRFYWHSHVQPDGPSAPATDQLETVDLDQHTASICTGWRNTVQFQDAAYLYAVTRTGNREYTIYRVDKPR